MKIDGDMAELIGIHIGDGCISRTKKYAEYYLGGDINEEIEYHDNWVAPLFNKKVMAPLLNKEVQYKKHPKVGIYGFHIFDERIVKFFEKFGITAGSKINSRIPNNIINNKKLILRFLRGLFDTDGTIYFDKNYSAKNPKNDKPRIQVASVSKNLIDDVLNSLISFGLHPIIIGPYKGKRCKNPFYTVRLYRKSDIKFFIDKIGFKNPKHLTKWEVFCRYGLCPPKTTLSQRKNMLRKHL